MTPLAKAILAALIVWTTPSGEQQGIAWCRPNCAAHAVEQAALLEQLADEHGVDKWTLTALAHNESRFNPRRVGKKGELGLLQIMPGSPWGKRAAESCARDPNRCDYHRAWWGAYAFANGLALCGDEHGAIGLFKTGQACKRGPVGARILRRARRMQRSGDG